jgi:hypothetical protein
LAQRRATEPYDDKSNAPWRWMLGLDCVIAPAVLLYTVFIDSPRYSGYMHLLVTYHFGFVRRAFVGSALSWFTDAVPFWSVYAIAIVAWIVTLILFVAVFRKVYGFKPENFPLFVFAVGSPFFFKNFAVALGHFDIYGCLWALVALLVRVGPLYPLLIAAGCVVLVLVHHLHFLLYIPTIGFIVLVRYGLLPGFSATKAVYCIVLALMVCAAFSSLHCLDVCRCHKKSFSLTFARVPSTRSTPRMRRCGIRPSGKRSAPHGNVWGAMRCVSRFMRF